MYTYLYPPEILYLLGRQLNSGTYEALTSQLQPGELLFIYLVRNMSQHAILIYSQSEYDEIEEQVKSGDIVKLGFYAMQFRKFQVIHRQ